MNARRVSPVLILLLLVLLFFMPIFANLQNRGGHDWDFICSLNELDRISIREYGQFPLWNPYSSGGRPLLANPQDGFPRPTFFLTFLFGCFAGLKIELVLLAFTGILGMFLLSRHLGANMLGGILAASIFGFSNFFSTRVEEGHFNFFGFFWLPFVAFFYLKSFENKKNLMYAALFLALCIFGGGAAHTAPIISIFLLSIGLFMAVQRRSARPLLFALLIILFALALAAIKVLPTLEYVSQHQRPSLSPEVILLDGLYQIFLVPEPPDFPGRYWGWQENAAYVGFIPLFLALIGVFRWWPKSLPFALTGVLSAFIGMGDFAPWTPWHIMHGLPFIDSLHVPSRFFVITVFIIALLAGLAVSFTQPKRKKRSAKLWALQGIALLVTIFAIGNLFLSDRVQLLNAFPYEPTPITRHDEFRQVVDANTSKSGAYSSLYLNLLANNGTLNAYEAVPHHVAAKAVGDSSYQGEAYLLDGGDASYEYWSPNKLVVRVKPANSTRLVINQNYDAGWHALGKNAEAFEGLLSTEISPQDAQVTFYYLPASFIIGLVVSIMAFALLFRWEQALRWLGKYRRISLYSRHGKLR
jgi:hypothetical protein